MVAVCPDFPLNPSHALDMPEWLQPVKTSFQEGKTVLMSPPGKEALLSSTQPVRRVGNLRRPGKGIGEQALRPSGAGNTVELLEMFQGLGNFVHNVERGDRSEGGGGKGESQGVADDEFAVVRLPVSGEDQPLGAGDPSLFRQF